MIAYAVGLGNVWRFPYLCFANGGGAFLVAYAFFWAFAAVPILMLEVTVGQLLQRGGIQVWMVCPLFKGAVSQHRHCWFTGVVHRRWPGECGDNICVRVLLFDNHCLGTILHD
jgi:SNF family Na+-dependent transporter